MRLIISFITRVNYGLMRAAMLWLVEEEGELQKVARFITRVNYGLMRGRSGPAGSGLYRARTTNPSPSKRLWTCLWYLKVARD